MTTVEQIIAESIREYKLQQAQRRRREIYKLIDYYSGTETQKYISNYFDADAFREIPLYSANFTKRFINKMSRIYNVGANRNVGSRYDELTIRKDARMKHIEKMTSSRTELTWHCLTTFRWKSGFLEKPR